MTERRPNSGKGTKPEREDTTGKHRVKRNLARESESIKRLKRQALNGRMLTSLEKNRIEKENKMNLVNSFTPCGR